MVPIDNNNNNPSVSRWPFTVCARALLFHQFQEGPCTLHLGPKLKLHAAEQALASLCPSKWEAIMPPTTKVEHQMCPKVRCELHTANGSTKDSILTCHFLLPQGGALWQSVNTVTLICSETLCYSICEVSVRSDNVRRN